jgi:CheY-like chemotaxis protein
MLEVLGHSTTTATSGEEALALIDQGFRPDLVMLDVHMPGIGGLETLVQLRQRNATLPILLTTGYPTEPLQELVKEHPGVHLLAKPYDSEALRPHL